MGPDLPAHGVGDGLTCVRPLPKGLEANKTTIKVPVDWQVDESVLHTLVRARLDELDRR